LVQGIDEIAEVAAWHDFEYMDSAAGGAADSVGRCGRRAGDDAAQWSAVS